MPDPRSAIPNPEFLMPVLFSNAPATSAIPILFVTKSTWESVAASLPERAREFAVANGCKAKAGECLTLPGADGKLAYVLFGLEDDVTQADPFRVGQLPAKLPKGTYRFANEPHDARLAALAFALGSYRFGRYKKAEPYEVSLVPPEGINANELTRMVEAAALARDLINTPPNDMGPDELAGAAKTLADEFGSTNHCVNGEELAREFPLIHAVGMASTRAPRLIDFSWGDASHPKVTLVGKGVCFDTGGLDLKPSRAMRNRSMIRSGGCRCGSLMMRGSIRRSPTSTTRRPAASQVRSPAHCLCSASSALARAGCTPTSMAGRPRRNLPVLKAASARAHAHSTSC